MGYQTTLALLLIGWPFAVLLLVFAHLDWFLAHRWTTLLVPLGYLSLWLGAILLRARPYPPPYPAKDTMFSDNRTIPSYTAVHRRDTLEKIRLGIENAVSEHFIDTYVDITEDITEYLPRLFVIRVRGYLYGERAAYKEVKFPADWWQAFKVRWFPAWALRRWPVVHTTVRFEAKAIYPHFRPLLHREEYQLLLSESTFTPPHRTP